MKTFKSKFVFTVFFLGTVSLSANVHIVKLQGDVKVRMGLDEVWQTASSEMILKNIDTILTGERSAVTLKLSEGITFTLGSQSILDIGDLREITERELFLYLTAEKVKQIPNPGSPKVRIENVSVVRAENKSVGNQPHKQSSHFWRYEVNGAKALHDQKFFPNAVIKLMNILKKYGHIENGGLVNLYLGQSFEALEKNGRALDAYHQSLQQSRTGKQNAASQDIQKSAEAGIQRLK